MELDQDVCHCCHVSLRKLVSFARRVRPELPSQMVDCLGAGTGCGWCIPILKRIAEDPDGFAAGGIDAAASASDREAYLNAGKPKNRF
jgi:bacterioferritin-associated ferredoxin